MKRIFQTAGAAIHAFFMPGDFDGYGIETMDERRETRDERLERHHSLEERLRPHAERLGISVTAIRRRITVLGWPLRRALTETRAR